MELRVGTAEREAVARHLGTAMAEGRLTLFEYEERVGKVWSSATRGELAQVTADLPAPVDDDALAASEDGVAPWREYLDEWKEWIGVSILLTGIWGVTSIASGEIVYYWPIWPLGIWGAVLLASIFWGDDEDDEPEKLEKKKAIEE